jgi:PAS domain S-box-containing protein
VQRALSTEELKDGRVETEQLLAAIIGSSQDAIISSDCDGVITVWNPGAERLYGYAASEAIGQPVRLLMPPARRGEEQTVLGRALAGERVEYYQTERVCKDGSAVTVSVGFTDL